MSVDAVLPAGWIRTTLGEVVDYGRTEKAEPDEIADNAWVMELEDIEKDSSRILQHVTFSERKSKSTKNRFRRGDVLYGKLRPYLNKVVIADAPGYCTTEIIPIKPNESVDGRYLFYWLKHPAFLDYVTAVSHGLNMPRLGTEAGKKAPFVLAPLAEQKRIADKLDRLLAAVDTCKARLDAIPAILKRFRQSVLAAATSGELTKKWRELAQQESSWTQVQLGEIAQVIDPNPTHRYPSYRNGVVPIVATEQFRDRDGYELATSKLVSESFYEERLRAHGFLPEDIVFARKGRLGLARRVPTVHKFVFSHTIFIVRPTEPLISPYLLWHLRDDACVDWLLRTMNSNTGVPTLGKAVMQRLPIGLPPLQEQAEVVRRVESLFSTADRLEAKVHACRALVEKVAQSLFIKAFRGEFVSSESMPSSEAS